MKIASVECLPVYADWRKNFVFVRVETDSGLVGWGEAYSQYDRDTAIAAQVTELGRYLVGRDPFHIRHILQMAFDDYAQRRGSLEFYCATSGIEQALWDIVGKETQQPIYNLLGGPVRSQIRVYANGWSYKLRKPEDFARAAEAVVKRGFSAIKYDPVPGPWRTFIPKDHIRHAVKVMRAVRDAVGPDVDLLLDIHRRLAPMHAIDLANALAEFDPYWFEEPCQSENVEALSNCGGILELTLIAAAAETEAIAVSPHNYNSTTMSLSATVHAAACMPNFISTEYFLPFEEISERLCPDALKPVNGQITLPEGSGLGLTVNEQVVRAEKSQQFPARTFRSFTEEGLNR
jgi:galactonate dehydratase